MGSFEDNERANPGLLVNMVLGIAVMILAICFLFSFFKSERKSKQEPAKIQTQTEQSTNK